MGEQNQKIILGIDEVGRGPWAGPLVVGAVILGNKFQDYPALEEFFAIDASPAEAELPPSAEAIAAARRFYGISEHTRPEDAIMANELSLQMNPRSIEKFQDLLKWREITDSKKLTARKREELSNFILQNAAGTGLGWVSSEELDRLGLSQALKKAAREAVEKAIARYDHHDPAGSSLADTDHLEIVIDGTINLLEGTPLESKVTLLKKADALVKEVGAASIIAKVARDTYMADLDHQYPGYGFADHVGYGTAAHQAALEKLGPCPEHRRSFRPVQELMEGKNEDRELAAHYVKGKSAEDAVAEYLEQIGHEVIAHNFKTKTCEIDLISIKDGKIYFTEVKYSQDAEHGTPLERINAAKREQMRHAAKTFLSEGSDYAMLEPMLAVAAVSGPEFQVDDWFALAD